MPQKKQKTPKDFWIEFCSSTGVRGFSYITKSICVAEEWFWGVMIIICGALTVYDISINVSKYLSYPTSTKVVVFNNDTISLGSPTICIDIDIESLDYSGIDLTKPETVRQFLSQFRNENIEDLLLYEFYKMRNRSALSLSEQSRLLYASDFPINWGDLKLDSRLSPLVSLTTAMIGAVVRHENLIRGDYGPEDYNWGIVKFDRDSEFFYVDQANSAAIYEVYKFYMKRNSHLKTLHRLSGALLCQMVDLNLVVHLRNETNGLLKSLAYTPCDPKKISWLGTPPYSDISREVVCVRLVNDVAFTFKTPEERTVISLNQAAIFHRPNYFAEAIRIDFSEDPSVTHKAQNLLWVMFGNNSEVTVSLLGHYKQLQSGRNPCNPTSHTQCKMSCR